MALQTLILMGTSGCHLCEEAEQLLQQVNIRFSLQVVDIVEKTEYYDAYALKIPVLYHPVSERSLCWPFDSKDIGHFLKALTNE